MCVCSFCIFTISWSWHHLNDFSALAIWHHRNVTLMHFHYQASSTWLYYSAAVVYGEWGKKGGEGGTAGVDNRHFSILFWHSLFTLSVSIVSESFSSSNVKQLPILSFPKAGRTIAHCLIWIKRVVENPRTFDILLHF